MLEPDYLNLAGEKTAAVYTQIESEMLAYLVEHMLKGDIANQRSQTALLSISQSNASQLLAILNKYKGQIDSSVADEVTEALKTSDADDLRRIKQGMGVDLPAITTRQIAATVAGVRDILARDNLDMVQSAQNLFLTESIWAITQVNTGAMTTERALHEAVRRITAKDLSIISYRNTETGKQTVRNHVDVAVRRHIRTQILQDSMRRTEQILDDAGVELVEVSSHSGSRPSHAKWEGKVYSRHGDKVIDGVKYKDFRTACKWGDVADGIGGANCRHSYAAYFPGMKRQFEPNPKHPSGKSNEEVYKLTQQQRQCERDIRQAKRDLKTAEEVYKESPLPVNQVEVSKAKIKLQKKQAKIRKLINDNPSVLQRSPRREWACDMPKVNAPKASGVALDKYLESKSSQLEKAGISKTRMKKSVTSELQSLGLKPSDFPKLSTSNRNRLLERAKELAISKLPSTKKARAGKHAVEVTLPKTISGVERSTLSMTHEEVAGQGLNQTNDAFNCQTCVVAYDANRKGYWVTAKKYDDESVMHDVSFKNEIPWIDPKTGMKREFTETGTNTPKRLMKYLEDTVQEGERYVIRYTPRGMDFRHVIILERSNGNLRMYDPQADIEYLDAKYRNHIRCDIEYKRTSYGIKEEFPISILRIDDLVFDEDIVNEILEPRK